MREVKEKVRGEGKDKEVRASCTRGVRVLLSVTALLVQHWQPALTAWSLCLRCSACEPLDSPVLFIPRMPPSAHVNPFTDQVLRGLQHRVRGLYITDEVVIKVPTTAEATHASTPLVIFRTG